ncbi:MAG: class I SAM-dependent methyltransferase [Chthoniobacterales bacterium]
MNRPEDLAEQFAALGPWIYQFQIDGKTYGGPISAEGDVRVERFFRYVAEPKSILELGALEGAHSFILAERSGVERVVALEGREASLRKARFVQNLLAIPNVEFVQANLEHTDLARFRKFDAVFCCGLLYHLPEPWTLLEQLPSVAPVLYIWTQYAREEEARDVGPGWRGKIHIEGGADEPLSGMSATATWLTIQSLCDLLRSCGYNRVDVIYDDPAHPNGPAVTIGATTA